MGIGRDEKYLVQKVPIRTRILVVSIVEIGTNKHGSKVIWVPELKHAIQRSIVEIAHVEGS